MNTHCSLCMWRSVENDLRIEECVYCGHKHPFVSEYMQGEYVKYKCMMCQKSFEKPGVDESAFKSVEWNENDKKFYYKTLLAEEENIPAGREWVQLTEKEIAASREWVASEKLAHIKYENYKLIRRTKTKNAIILMLAVAIIMLTIWSAYWK